MSRRLAPVVLVPLALVAAAIGASPASAQPLTSHPRIWIRQSDLPRLRSWAVSSNPLYQDGIRVVATTLKTKMDDGSLLANDHGTTYGYTQYPIEWAAQVFAFMSLVENDANVRADCATRAHPADAHDEQGGALPDPGRRRLPRSRVLDRHAVALLRRRLPDQRSTGSTRISRPRTRRRSAPSSCAGSTRTSPRRRLASIIRSRCGCSTPRRC